MVRRKSGKYSALTLKGGDNMTIISQLKERRAVRDHEPREVEQEKIEQLLEAATWAPNDRMREP